jgi:TetR/AcrR family transcriptional regulator, fatty acid metabolism regulator protein
MVAQKRLAILKAAEHLFAAQGFNQTKIADIAKESQIHEASIYAYFKNKKNILFDIYGEQVRGAVQGIKEHFQGMKEPGPKLRKLIWSYLADIQNNPNYGKILMMAQRESHDFYNSKHLRYVKEYSDVVSGLVVAGQKDGLFRTALSPRAIKNMVMGTAVFTAIHGTVNHRPYDPDEMSDVIYHLVLNAAGVYPSSPDEKTEKGKKRERIDHRKTQIVEAATQVFSRKGFSNATISDVAKHARLGDATLYEYFVNKDDILMGIAGTYLQIFSCEAFWLTASPKAEQFLKKMIWKVIWQLYFNEDFSRVLILDLFRNVDFYYSPQYKDFEDLQKKILEWVENGQQEGVFIKDFPSLTYFHMIIGTLDQFLLEQFVRNSAPLGLVELNAIVESLVRAIKVRETA